MARIHRLAVPVAATSLLALTDCGDSTQIGPDPTCGVAYFDVGNYRVGTFGTTADARKVEAFLQATVELDRAVDEMHDTTLAACEAIGRDLGLAQSEYVPMGNEPRVATVCRRVIQEVRTIVRAGLPTGATLRVVASPPVCRVDVDVAAQCTARCTGQASVMAPRCNGTLVMDCNASCDAVCSGSCSAGCTGQCSGTCTGQCTGTCTGQCEGTCTAMDGTGRCIGQCMGTCRGSCSAGCTGSCTGTCSAGCMGTCMGQCRGMCSVMSTVRCDGTWDVQADVECQAACRAQASARAVCTEPQVALAASAMVNAQGRARLDTLLTSLLRNYPTIVRNAHRAAGSLTTTVPAFASSVQGAAQAARNVSVTAGACMTRAVLAATETTLRFQATVQVSVDFNASLTAQGG